MSDLLAPQFSTAAFVSNPRKIAITYVFSHISWKQILRSVFPERKFVFLPADAPFELISKNEKDVNFETQNLGKYFDIVFFNTEPSTNVVDFCTSKNIDLYIISSGLIRSIESINNHPAKQSYSYMINKNSSIFDFNQNSELLQTLNNFNFASIKNLKKSIDSYIKIITENSISYYNNRISFGVEELSKSLSQQRNNIVIIGRTAGEELKTAGSTNIHNLQLCRIARLENPHEKIIFKPHQSFYILEADAKDLYLKDIADVVDEIILFNISIFPVLKSASKVYTIDSHAGFEALMCQIPVVTFGAPWYAGWGLTDDRTKPNKPRERKLSVQCLFAAAYIMHSVYIDDLYKNQSDLSKTITRVMQEKSVCLFDATESAAVKNSTRLSQNNDPLETIRYLASLPENLRKSMKLNKILIDEQIRAGLFSEAVESLSKTLQLDPENGSLYFTRAEIRIKAGDFSERVDADFFKALDCTPVSKRITLIHKVFSFLWEKSAVTEKMINKFNFYLNQIPLPLRKGRAYANILLIKANILVEINQYASAAKLYTEAKSLGATLDKRALALRYAMRKFGDQKATSDMEYQAFGKLLSQQDRFRELVLEAQGSVCIVGNSPLLLGKGLGAEIDNHQVVIRFNSYNSSYPYSEDYGVKTDVWTRMIFHPYVHREPQSGLKLVIFSGSNRLYRPYTEWFNVLDYVNSGLPVQFFPRHEFYELQHILGAPPTSGLMMCYMLYKIIGPLQPHHYYGVSFAQDSVFDEANYHYSDQNAQSGPRHDWDREAAFFQTIKAKPGQTYPKPRTMLQSAKVATNIDTSNSQGVTTDTTDVFDRVFTTSPGLIGYVVFGCAVEHIDSKSCLLHLRWAKDQSKGEQSTLLSTIQPHQKACILGFGRAQSGAKARELAEALNAEYRLVEYGLISSMHLPSEKQFNFSLILDNQGIFYDTTAPSLIEQILLNDHDIFSVQMSQRAQDAMRSIYDHNITKYNNSPDMVLPPNTMARHRILVIDQTAGDNSIIYGQCEQFSFRDMLQHALQQPNSEVILKIHPETAAGAKDGNLTEIADLLENPNLHVIGQQCNIVSLIKQVDEVYVMTSGVGLEALIIGKPVRCFGVPFYSGWGLTQDMTMVKNTRRPLTLHALFAATFIKYNHFYHPDSRQPCSLETCLQWIIANKPSLPSINMEWST